jgi:hypothetical protein
LGIDVEPQLSKDDVKEALKQAHKEWLDDHFAAVGRWTLMAFAGLLFAAFIQLMVWLRSPVKNETYQRGESPRIESPR